MDESLKFFKEQFDLQEVDIRTYSPLVLAYIGDCVYEIIVRTILVNRGNCQVNKLHKRASQLVKAGAQCKMMEILEPMLTPEEEQIYKRGRNAHSGTTAKNATMGEYKRATGFEAVMGYLYLQEDWKRITELAKAGISYIEQ